MRPETRYAKSPDGYVAYQVFGDAPRDILFVPSWATNLDAMWDEPSCAHYFERLSRFGRVICFDKRGTGVSDPVPLATLPTLEEWMDDALLALDAAGSRQASIIGDTEGGPMAMLLAATHPERMDRLVLVNTFARWSRAPDYPIGMPAETVERLLSRYEQHWGQDARMLEMTAPGIAADPRMREWFTRMQRLAMPPGAATRMYRWVLSLDVRSALPAISVPTQVLHRRDNRHYRFEFGRHLAEHIPGARFVELPGADCFPFHTPAGDAVLAEIQEFLTGVRTDTPAERELSTVVFTDIVGSTRELAEVGDKRFKAVLDVHDRTTLSCAERFRGNVVRTTGDGALLTFDGPARALRFVLALRQELEMQGIDIRAGVHAGEIEVRGNDLTGLAVHIGARVMEACPPGQVVCSRTVKDLVAGAGLMFEDLGTRTLKGVPDDWQLFAVSAA